MTARVGNKTFIVLGAALLAGAALCASGGMQGFAEGYFLGALLAVSVPVGSLGMRLVHALTGGRWGEPLRPWFESASRLMPMALLLWLPVFFWLARIYPWARPETVAADPELLRKAGYLNGGFFIVRSVVYFAVWSGVSLWLDRFNAKTDLSGLLAVLYFLVGTFAAMDWVMSLMPHWYSTIFGATFITGQALLAYCFAVMMRGFAGQPAPPGAPGPAAAAIDEGSLLLTLVLFWAYLAFSQFLTIWMGNLPHEVAWYTAPMRNGWGFMAPVIIAGHLFLPLFLLLRRSWKARPLFLAAVALFLILMRAGDLAWMVFSGLSRDAGALTIGHAGAVVAVMSLFLLAWFMRARGEAA